MKGRPRKPEDAIPVKLCTKCGATRWVDDCLIEGCKLRPMESNRS